MASPAYSLSVREACEAATTASRGEDARTALSQSEPAFCAQRRGDQPISGIGASVIVSECCCALPPRNCCVAEQEYFNMQTKPNIETWLISPELDYRSKEPPIINNSSTVMSSLHLMGFIPCAATVVVSPYGGLEVFGARLPE